MTKEEKIYDLAKRISKAGSIISADSISKDYLLDKTYKDTIVVYSDSGYEAIYIGNIEGKSSDGYMCLYTNNTSKRNSYPRTKEIAELLMKVVNKEKLEVGEGKANYYDWAEFGGIDKQINYFSKVVCKMAKIKDAS